MMLVLSSAFFHASWSALLKRHEDPESAVVGVITITVMCGGLWALGLQGAAFPTSGALMWGLMAGVLESGYLVTLAKSLSRAPLGLAYTVSRGGAVLLVWPVSVLWLNEQLTPGSVAGATLVAVGMAGMNLVLPRGREKDGVLWSLASAACIAGYNLSYKRALGEGAQPPALFTLSLGVALPLLVLMRRREETSWGALLQKIRTRPLLLVAAGVLCTLSFSLMLVALTGSGTGAVITLRNTSIVFALALGALQNERMGRRQLAGAGLVVIGAVLLGWPRK
ncbi:permease of DMT superfamily [Cystobacter fuscus DSM 2262]|uniref:Permease of DMT superfamily n=1 Tax=Cystobacter fuscus (strain ATCC 25194 / DSM 2262 / NBRC 100088 / M29) TaxID=1242864 RepID=S9PH37_CYSF2|nr:DMT family transporter [Cystobacter fuscus]EPX61732.1 permease of DMT superfamily [Cystobacter fuscus DSM 2262]